MNYRNIALFSLNAMFDRSLSGMRVNCRDDLARSRIVDNGKIARDYCTSNNDFLHADELPLYVEIENEEEDNADDHDGVTDGQSTAKTV